MNQRFIGPSFLVTIVCSIGLCVVYVNGGDPQWEGVLLFGAFGGLATAMILWAKHLFPQDEVEQHRHTLESTPEEQEEFNSLVETGTTDVTRRRFLTRLGLGAVGALGLAALFPLRSLGPASNDNLWHTEWKAGTRLVDEYGKPVRPDTLAVGGILTVWPGLEHEETSATLLVRVPQSEFTPRTGRDNWTVDGNVAYSKICTHIGCPVALYRESTHELLCPCHQSTFDVLEWARPVFGPATRPLPQLPLDVDAEGYLIARSDYQEPIGPGFWNRGRGEMKTQENAGGKH